MPLAASTKSFAPMKTWLPPLALSACMQAVFCRSIVDMNLTDAQRWGHFPISTMVGFGCLLSGSAELLEAASNVHADTPLEPLTKLTLSAVQTTPRTVFYLDAWLALTGMSPSGLTDSFVDPRDLRQADLLAVCQRLCSAGDEAALVNQFFAELLPIWQKRARHEKKSPSQAKAVRVS